MKGKSHTRCHVPFGSVLLLLRQFFYIGIFGRYKRTEARDLQRLAGGLEERLLQPCGVQGSVVPCQNDGVLLPWKRGRGLTGSSKEEGACCICQAYFSLGFTSRWAWACRHRLYLPVSLNPKGVRRTCLMVLWMWPHGRLAALHWGCRELMLLPLLLRLTPCIRWEMPKVHLSYSQSCSQWNQVTKTPYITSTEPESLRNPTEITEIRSGPQTAE